MVTARMGSRTPIRQSLSLNDDDNDDNDDNDDDGDNDDNDDNDDDNDDNDNEVVLSFKSRLFYTSP